MIQTVFFDLDDTIFDHQYSRRCGLATLKSLHPALSLADIRDMERFHEQLTQANFERVLSGELPLADAITERICRVCSRFGYTLEPGDIPETVQRYDTEYRQNRRIIPGCRELLEQLHDEVQVGIITNGFSELQKEKIELCGIAPLIDILVISEEAGVRKPDRRIFEQALARAGSRPEESCYVGDSWSIDILPASAYGLKAIWLNRYGYPCPDPSRAREIASYRYISIADLLE